MKLFRMMLLVSLLCLTTRSVTNFDWSVVLSNRAGWEIRYNDQIRNWVDAPPVCPEAQWLNYDASEFELIAINEVTTATGTHKYLGARFQPSYKSEKEIPYANLYKGKVFTFNVPMAGKYVLSFLPKLNSVIIPGLPGGATPSSMVLVGENRLYYVNVAQEPEWKGTGLQIAYGRCAPENLCFVGQYLGEENTFYLDTLRVETGQIYENRQAAVSAP